MIVDVTNNYLQAFNEAQAEILKNFTKHFNLEGYNGTSDVICKINEQFYILFYYTLVANSYYNTEETWGNIVIRYKLKELEAKAACCGINIKKLTSKFNLPTTVSVSELGINFIEVNKTFIVEPSNLFINPYPTRTINILDYMDDTICKYYWIKRKKVKGIIKTQIGNLVTENCIKLIIK